jgi:hypothetical protein
MANGDGCDVGVMVHSIESMKRAIYTLLFFVLMLSPVTPVLAKSKDYPMRVQVVRTHWHARRGWFGGFGRANLISQQPGQPPEQGMNFNFGCSGPVRISFGPDTYPARYGKNQYEVVVQLPELGSDKMKDCTLRIQMENYVYVRTGHGLFAAPLAGGPQTQVNEGGDASQ